MSDFSGATLTAAEPLVGEIRALRTFRVEETGLLLPLYAEQCWYDGANRAVCRRGGHAVPADDCDCGFYAYGSAAAARQQSATRYLQAVVSCWGGVVAGSQGIRAQHARIEAIWLHPSAPDGLRRRIRMRYPSACQYDDVAHMLTEHPLTALPCYDPPDARAGRLPRPGPRSLTSWAALALAVVASLVLGSLPAATLHDLGPLWVGWLAAVAVTTVGTLWLTFAARFAGHLVAAGLCAALVAWLVAPWLGLGGWLLRLPILRGALVAAAGAVMRLRPRYFPVVPALQERVYFTDRVC